MLSSGPKLTGRGGRDARHGLPQGPHLTQGLGHTLSAGTLSGS